MAIIFRFIQNLHQIRPWTKFNDKFDWMKWLTNDDACFSSTVLANKRMTFAARLRPNAKQPPPGRPQVFGDVIENVGRAYDSSTGYFRVSKYGLYYLSVSTEMDCNLKWPTGMHNSFQIFIPGLESDTTCYVDHGSMRDYCNSGDRSYYRRKCSIAFHSSKGYLYSSSLSDISILNPRETYMTMSYLNPCLTPEFLIFSANAPAPPDHYLTDWYNRSVQFIDFRITRDLITLNRFGFYDPASGNYTAPFDGLFLFKGPFEDYYPSCIRHLTVGQVFQWTFSNNVSEPFTVYYLSPCLPDPPFQIPYGNTCN
jgi:hypothetical protein